MNRPVRFVCLSLAALSILTACQGTESTVPAIPESSGENFSQMTTFAKTLTGVGVFPGEANQQAKQIDVVYVYRNFATTGAPALNRVVLSGTLDSNFSATLTSDETTNDIATITCDSASCETGVLELTKKGGKYAGTASVNFSHATRAVVAEQGAQTAGDDAAAQLAQAFNSNSVVNNIVSTYEVVDGLTNFFSVKVILANDTPAGIRGATGANVPLTINFEGAAASTVQANVSIDSTKTLVVDFAPGAIGLQSLRATPQ